MKVTVDSKKDLKTYLKVSIDKKTIEEKVNIRLTELSKTVNLKGFRPGKVPPQVLKLQFGKSIYDEVLEKILKETSTKAIEEKKIKVAGQPKIDLKSYGEGKDLNYTLEIDQLPLIKLQPIENIKSINYEITVTEKETNQRINDIAKSQSNFIAKEAKETARNEDLITFDYEATIDNKSFEGGSGKNTQIVLGKDLFIKEFDKHLLGVKKNQEINVPATLPENYPTKDCAGKKAIFKCKILSIKKSVPIKVDEQFAKNLGAKDLNDLRKLVNNQIKNQYKMSLDSITKENIMDQIEKFHDIKLPDNLVKQELELISQGLKKEDLEKNIKGSEKVAKKRIKLGLILNEFGEKNNLKVDDQEVKNAIQKQVQSMPGQQKQVLDYYEKNPSASASLRGSIYEEKITNLIIEKSRKTKKIVTTKEAEQLIKEQHKNHDHAKDHEHSDDKKSKKSKKSKKTVKSSTNNKKIRKK